MESMEGSDAIDLLARHLIVFKFNPTM
ncbi:uncharacterized protein METZ01_LOCUS178939 [marine metagenome]|uniref:Uncharacterized protein n=1 Tax=marine metagenome TaxID=408172 RepID=A0A382CJ37_9ZZZZ